MTNWNIEPKFKRGQKVWQGYSEYQTKHGKCPTCLGTGHWTVTAPSGEQMVLDCDKCQYGHVVEGYPFVPFVRELTIGTLRIDTGDPEPISYMCEETGIGSGTIHRESKLCETEEQAWEQARAYAAEREAAREQTQREIDAKTKRRARRSASKQVANQKKISELQSQLASFNPV